MYYKFLNKLNFYNYNLIFGIMNYEKLLLKYIKWNNFRLEFFEFIFILFLNNIYCKK